MIVRTRATVRIGAAAALAVTAMGGLAACSSPAGGSADTGATAPSASSGGSAAASGGASAATGTWTETGEYQTPGGRESVEVTLTAKDGTVTAVEVKGSGGSPNSQRYQGQFISGISAEVVGKPLATLKVGAVSGSSLTGQGFNAAVDEIRSDAA